MAEAAAGQSGDGMSGERAGAVKAGGEIPDSEAPPPACAWRSVDTAAGETGCGQRMGEGGDRPT